MLEDLVGMVHPDMTQFPYDDHLQRTGMTRNEDDGTF
jgi:hypothetical protein